MVRTAREWLALALLVLLPLHALLVTFFTLKIVGPGHAPLTMLAVWKEGVLALLLMVAFIELWPRIRSSSDTDSPWTMDVIDWCILLGILLAVAVSYAIGSQSSSMMNVITGHLSVADKRFLVGFKYDFLPLVVFVALRRLQWSAVWLRRAVITILVVGVLIVLYGILTVNLPISFFTHLGYSDQTSLYFSSGPLAAVQQVEGSLVRRVQSTLSGPNQFGLWLLIPLAAAISSLSALVVRRHVLTKAVLTAAVASLAVGAAVILLGIAMSLSRTAWIAAAAMILLTLVLLVVHSFRMDTHKTLMVSALAGAFLVLAVGGYAAVRHAPSLLLRLGSSRGHVERSLAALQMIKAHPFGLGLGTAGPASNAFSDTCVFLRLGDDFSWAKSRKDICLFLGGVRKLPPGKVCECPLLTENWYLQFGVEMGWLGVLFSLALAVLILIPIMRIPLSDPRFTPLLAFLGFSVAGLFLHSFEDSAVAYTVWLLLAAAVPVTTNTGTKK